MMGWLRNLFIIIILIAVIVLSFWISFLIGKRMLIPAKKIPTGYLITEEARPQFPPEISLEVQGLTVEEAIDTPEVAEAPKIIVKPKTENKQVPAAKGKYTVQLGVFSKYNNAQTLLKELSNKGFSAEIKSSNRFYRVVAGRFSVLSAAGAHLKKLKSSGYEGIIRRY